MKKILMIFVLSLVATFNAQAGTQTGKIISFVVRASDNLHYLFLEGEKTDGPECAAINYWMIADENSAAGKTQISLIIAAKLAGKTITIHGTNTCSRWADGESINAITLK